MSTLAIIFVALCSAAVLNTAIRAWRDRAIAKATGSDPIAMRSQFRHNHEEIE